MYQIRVDIILFGCVMVHLQKVFDKPSTLEVTLTQKRFPKYILGFISWIIYIFCKSLHFVLEWLNYITYDFTLFYYHLISSILLHVWFI